MPQIRQEINIINVAVTGSAAANDSALVQLDTTQYVNPTYYFEVVHKGAASNTGTWTLRRNGTTTDDATTVAYTSATVKRERTASFTPPAGQTTYFLRNNADGTRSQTANAARIIVIDNPTTLTSSETQIEIGPQGATTYTATTAIAATNDKYWLYTSANWDGTKTFFAEVTYKTASTNTATITLQEDSAGTFASFADKVTIVSAVSNTSATRTRSIAFTPTAGRNYRIAVKSSTTKSSVTIYNAKVIVDQSSAFISNNTSGGSFSVGSTSNGFGASQSFTGSGNTITSVTFSLSRFGSPTGNAVAKIYAHSGTFGTSSIPTGAALATSDNFDVSTLATTSALKNITFSGANQFLTTNGTNYCITFEYSAGDSSNFVHIFSSTSSVVSGNAGQEDSSLVWTPNSTNDLVLYIYDNSVKITLLEPQYLLLNTADSNATGVQSYQTLWDSTEWAGIGNPTDFKHAMDSDNASNSAKLRDITGSADVTNSTVTGANQQISAGLTMPTTGHEIDTWILNTTGVVGASRILAIVGPSMSVSDSLVVTDSVSVSISAGAATLSVSVSDSITLSEFNDQLRAGARDLSVSDSETMTESVTLREDSFISKSEAVSLSESVLMMQESYLSVSDTEAATDSLLRMLEALINKSESVSLSESASEFVTPLYINVSDSIAVTDSVVLRQDSFISESEAISLTEAVSFLETSFISVNDSLSLSEAQAMLLSAFINVFDTEAITDSVTLQELSFISVTDTEAITDSVFMQELSFINKSDSIAITDSTLELIPTLFLTVNDSIAITDSTIEALISFVSVNDNLSLSEALSLLNQANVTVSDTEAITDSVARMLESFISKSEAVSLSESLSRMLESYISTSDSEVITDTTTELIPTLFISVNDSLAITESVNVVEVSNGTVNVNDSLSITEAVSLLIPTLFLSVNDSITLSESVTKTLISFISKSDTLGITDSTNEVIPNLNLSVNDSLNITESVGLAEVSFVRASETVSITENISVIQTGPQTVLSLSVSDTLILTDSILLLLVILTADSLEGIIPMSGTAVAGNSDADPINNTSGAPATGNGDENDLITNLTGVATNAVAGTDTDLETSGVAVNGLGDSLDSIDSNSGSPANATNDSGY